MFEALVAGRVPVNINDAYAKLARIDWDSCSLTAPEFRIAKIPKVIAESTSTIWSDLLRTPRQHGSPTFLHIMLWTLSQPIWQAWRKRSKMTRFRRGSTLSGLAVLSCVATSRPRPRGQVHG